MFIVLEWQIKFKRVLPFVSVPAAGPNVTAKATNSTAILVTWDEIKEEKQNGVIEGYRISYNATDGLSPFEQLDIMNATAQEIQLENLRVFTEYKITVSGRTTAGFGVGSEVTQRTLEEGMLKFNSNCFD